ncbi:MAG: glycosyltransferase [Thermoanaerobaculia bacterium]|jgi:GT2 family glycosyltransferase/glycosyltransferase involved in cell wall biosynthesis
MTVPAAGVRCDLVIPVYNALRSTRDCLESVRRYAPPWARVVVINDGSDGRTTEFLRAQKGIVLLENEANLGFVKTANRGLLFSDAPWICLLNSDTLLTEGALERMVAGCEKDPTIGLCCPLSNSAVNLSVRLPQGADVFSFARRVARTSPARYPDATTIVGHCLLVRREVIRTLGAFDEIYGRGYCEETDLHYRARAAGWRCVVADDTWIHHRQGASFPDSGARISANLEILMSRWRERHEKELAEFDARNELGAVRDAATLEWALPDDGPPTPYDVLFVLPLLGIYGGVADVLELANALVLQGVRAGVVVLETVPPEIEMELFFRPLRLSAAELVERCPPARLLVATGYQTAAHVAAAAASRRIQTAYFVQDYEGWFGFDPPEYVAKTYDLIPRIVTISAWIAREIETRHGHAAIPIPISADPDVYYPRGDRPAAPPVRLAAMLRQDERRGMKFLLPALAEVARRPDVEILLFGQAAVPSDAPRFKHTHLGTLQREAMPRLLSTVHVVIDPSLFQGFGLIGLEGMASGAACVLTDSGGVSEYALHGVNALVVPPRDSDALAAGVRRLLEDPALRERLAAKGVETARRFTWTLTATRFRAFMDALPPAREVPPGERAALELLAFEHRTRTALVAERHELGTTLSRIAGSRVWKAAQRWRGLRDRLRGALPFPR